MVNASMIPVFANPIREQETSQKQENSVMLKSTTPDTQGAVQLIPVKDYIALKGEASLKGKEILNPTSFGNKEADKLALNSEAFVVLPEGQALSSEELEQIEGEALWFMPGIYGAGKGALIHGGKCYLGWASDCTFKGYAVAAGKGIVKAYLPWTEAGILIRLFW